MNIGVILLKFTKLLKLTIFKKTLLLALIAFWQGRDILSVVYAATEGVVEVYHALNLLKAICYLRELCGEEFLLSCQHLKVCRLGVAHKLSGAIYCALKGCNLVFADILLAASCLALCKGVVHLIARYEQGVTEGDKSLLLLCFCDFKVCALCPCAEDVCSEASGESDEPACWRCYRLTQLVLPAEATA